MAVYTVVGEDEARALVARLGLGTLTALEGITAGIENSNYFVDTTAGRYVLTLFERLSADQLPYYLGLMKHLAARGIPVPDPQADAQGELLFTLAGKPAALLTRLPGSHRLAPDEHHARQVGAMLARMHRAAADLPRAQPHLRGLDWWIATVPVVQPFLDAERAALLAAELDYQRHVAASPDGRALPRGAIHADLFRDNVMWDGLPGHEKLTGFLDFFFAGTDALAFDIAVCLNDWCIDQASGRLDEDRAAAFVAAYAAVRPLTAAEHRLMPALLRAAALRFWLSRLWDLHLPRDAALLKAHDPTHFERVLRQRIEAPWHSA
ncbi:MAG: homoserine kinase [Rubrivivax sp.]